MRAGDDAASRTPFAIWSETADPIPGPPRDVLDDPLITSTLEARPDLFAIVTPINVQRLRELLVTHPNQPFVESVCRGLEQGFWPGAELSGLDLPISWDFSDAPLRDPAHVRFARDYACAEESKGRYSAPFGPDLLPGMMSQPVHVVPKPNSTKFRLVNNHSAGDFSLNSMIPPECGRTEMDGIRTLAHVLRCARADLGTSARLVMFKSDVSEAYRLIPMHPRWQVRQIVTIAGERRVDRNNCFGSRAGGALYTSFMALVIWIAVHVKFILDLLDYVDDAFSYELATSTLYYEPYARTMPAKQARLLLLWDELGIPHADAKQVSGDVLTIIGFDVDPNSMRITYPPERRAELVAAIRAFARLNPSAHRRLPLRQFQHLAGWINWALTVFPHLRPGLSELYAKMAGKSDPFKPISISVALSRELGWLADWLDRADGVWLLDRVRWSAPDADLVYYTDASLSGMGFWTPNLMLGYQSVLPREPPAGTIFYFEALAVLSALAHAAARTPRPRRVVVFSDSMNTVDMFSSHRALPAYNGILKSAVDILLTHGIDLRVTHIPGSQNVVADALSRWRADLALAAQPALVIGAFTPPPDGPAGAAR
jgi:hypothetical protein